MTPDETFDADPTTDGLEVPLVGGTPPPFKLDEDES